jgi:hypothetical protein
MLIGNIKIEDFSVLHPQEYSQIAQQLIQALNKGMSAQEQTQLSAEVLCRMLATINAIQTHAQIAMTRTSHLILSAQRLIDDGHISQELVEEYIKKEAHPSVVPPNEDASKLGEAVWTDFTTYVSQIAVEDAVKLKKEADEV